MNNRIRRNALVRARETIRNESRIKNGTVVGLSKKIGGVGKSVTAGGSCVCGVQANL